MTRPTDQQIHELVERLRTTDWRNLELRLKADLRRDRSGTTNADGYPASTLTGGGGNELTSVESAAERRIAGTARGDKIRNHLEHAVGFLEQAAASTGALTNRLDAIDQLIDPDTIDRKVCESCAQGAPNPQAPEHYGSVNGRLTRPMHLCGPCYDFVFRYEPRDQARLPTVDELKQHDLTGRWRARRTR